MFPYIDLLGVKRRSFLRPSYFDDVEGETPGYTAQCIATNSSTINARLRKRYGKTGTLPFGQTPPALVAAGTAPPVVVLQGRPTLGSVLMVLTITRPGALGTARFTWSADGGITATAAITTAPAVLLGATGMTALFPSATYNAGNVYSAAPPVPEAILHWLTIFTSRDVLVRHGVRSEDPLMVGVNQEVERAHAQLEEAANQETGLIDLPTSEDLDTAIVTGGPRSHSEASPYAWTYDQQRRAQRERGGGSGGGSCPPNTLVGS